jgi:hypothetical protein
LRATLSLVRFILKPDIDQIKLPTLGKNGFYLLDKSAIAQITWSIPMRLNPAPDVS